MKHCKRSHKCPYGSAFEKNVCAYDENLNENDACPYLLGNWDSIILNFFGPFIYDLLPI